ncbi:hypothetical protein N7455_012708 [Penicillium solitum]|uniref:uncharacterized protein n=1 Tax=Penicillium solitum TaxID=60172 RepID=UPI0032C4328B|nr:hypothetical protein N7536_003851 [Penicillium majusculum]KAJ5848751.1 hypothetical protein N7455_012708 [Penicillium solitum]
MDILVCRRRLRLYDRQITGTVTVRGSGAVPRTECLAIDTAARNEVTERRSPRSEVACETQN